MSKVTRRDFILWVGAATIAVTCVPTSALSTGVEKLYGLIGKINAAPGKRDELIAILPDGVAGMLAQEAIARGRPLITGFGERFETVPVGAHGLVAEANR